MTDPTCAAVEDDEACGKPGYSNSVDHNNEWLCAKHYRDHLKNAKANKVKMLIESMTAGERQEMASMITGGKK